MPMRGIPVARDIDHWFSRLAPAQAVALQALRAQIRAAAPGAEETILYGQPTFLLHGHLVAFGAFKKYLSFFPMSSSLIKSLPEAAAFATSAGTLQFQPDKPLPAALVARMVKARIVQNLEISDARAAGKAKKKAAARPRPKSKRKVLKLKSPELRPPKPRTPKPRTPKSKASAPRAKP